MKTYIVTGGAGFIGGAVVRNLISNQSVRVINFDNLTYAGNVDSLKSVMDDPLHVFIQADICDRNAFAKVLREYRPQAILNLAAESHVDRSIDSPDEFVRTNVLGTFELLQASLAYWQELTGAEKNAFRFLHVSTDEVYGSLGPTGAFQESTPYAPNSPYSASKAASDHFVRAYCQTYGLPTLTINSTNNYGPYQFPEKLVPLMILNALEGRPLPVYGDGLHVRDWLFVEDHVRAIITVLDKGKPGETFNVGGNCERTNLDVVNTICKLVDRMRPDLSHLPCKNLINFVPDRPGHDRRYAMDTTKIHQELGFEPTETFESGLERTVAWYLENDEWVTRVTSGVYRRERLGLNTGGG